jgi:Cep192 domain 4
MTGAGTDACTVTLSAAAPTGGMTVSLSSSSASATVPASVTVAAGATSAGFTATVSSVSSAQTVTLTASAGSVTKTFALQLNAATPTLSINATSVGFGDVTVNTPSTQSITLTSIGTAPVTVSSASVSGTGFSISGLTFPLTLNPNQTATLYVQFDPTTTGTFSGQLTITSNSSSKPSAVLSLSGTGDAVSYEVDLTWDAPTSSPDPVAGYHVYRSTDGGTTYLLLNSTNDTQTTYADSNVQNGSAYVYYVKSVDASGVESVPSNTTSLIIP